nr:hypothetical protein [Tanacetum cinerariifolium]
CAAYYTTRHAGQLGAGAGVRQSVFTGLATALAAGAGGLHNPAVGSRAGGGLHHWAVVSGAAAAAGALAPQGRGRAAGILRSAARYQLVW